jgi:hypothetical protein
MAGEINVATSGDLDKSNISLNTPVSAAFQMDGGGEMPAQGALVLRNRKSGETNAAQIAGKSEIELMHGVRPGSYDIFLTGVPRAFIRSISGSGGKVSGRSVEVGSGPVKLNIVLTQGTGDLSGAVYRADGGRGNAPRGEASGRPVSGAMVLLVPDNPAINSTLFRRDQTNTDGSFELGAVIPGKYTLVAIEDGWELEWNNPDVLSKYLAHGEAVQIVVGGKLERKIQVQAR